MLTMLCDKEPAMLKITRRTFVSLSAKGSAGSAPYAAGGPARTAVLLANEEVLLALAGAR